MSYDELISLLNDYDDLACMIAVEYLKKHNLLPLVDRVRYEYKVDFGIIRPLRNVWIKLLNKDSLKFVEFYEDVYKFRRVPHYEDIITTALINILTGFIACAIYDYGKKLIPRLKRELEDFIKQAEVLFNYLIRVYAIRNACNSEKITYQKFLKLREYLKKKVF